MKQDRKQLCFVCGAAIEAEKAGINSAVMLPVCDKCSGTPSEKEKVTELLDSLADGLVCGCI